MHTNKCRTKRLWDFGRSLTSLTVVAGLSLNLVSSCLGQAQGLPHPSFNGGNWANPAITGGTLSSPAITGGTLSSPAITGGTLSSAAITGGTLTSPAITGGTLSSPAITGGTLTNPTSTGGTFSGGDITAQSVKLGGGAIANNLSTYLADPGLLVDRFYQPADGADDAPAMQRVVNLICSGATRSRNMRFLAEHYTINSQVQQPCTVNWKGGGYQEQLSGSLALPTAPGTWFDLGSKFIGVSSGQGPFLITAGPGSVIENFGLDEPGMPAAPVPVVNSSGQITGYNPSSWTPAAYWYAFEVQGSPGVLFRHIMLNGINAGFLVNGSGRTSFQDIKGQVFSYTFSIQESYDVSRITDVHIWPYWSSADPVMLYQQANAKVIGSGRNDSPFWDNIFGFGVFSTIDIFANTDGTTTGAQVGKVQCDSNIECVHIENLAAGQQASMSIAEVRTFDQVWSTIYGYTTTHNPNSTLLQLDGGAVLQIGQIENFGTDVATITEGNATSPSNVQIGSIYVHLNQMSGGGSFPASTTGDTCRLVKFPTATGTVGALVTVSMPPLLAGTCTSYEATNTPPNGSGIGTLQWNMPTVQH